MVSKIHTLPKKIKPTKSDKSKIIKKEKNEKSVLKVKPTKDIKEIENPKENVHISGVVKSKVKYVMPTKYITENLVNNSLSALHQLASHYKKRNALFEDETPIFAEINCLKIQISKGNIKFVLPHSTVPSTGEVCLVTPDIKKGRKIDHEPTVDHWEELLRKAGITNVKTVLPIRQLKVEYDQYELKRRLLTQHDFIMVDTRVLNHASHLLGKSFFKKHNMLIPVRINEGDLKKNIDIGLRTAMLRLNEGPTSTITIGHTGMPQDEIKNNILSLIQQIQAKYPGGQANIRSIALKFPLSVSLPLYITLRPSNTMHVPKMIQKKPKNFTILEGELSTQLGKKVRVAPDGTVLLSRIEDVEMSDNNQDENNENSEESDEEQGDSS